MQSTQVSGTVTFHVEYTHETDYDEMPDPNMLKEDMACCLSMALVKMLASDQTVGGFDVGEMVVEDFDARILLDCRE